MGGMGSSYNQWEGDGDWIVERGYLGADTGSSEKEARFPADHSKNQRCHPERGRRRREGPYDLTEVAQTQTSALTVPAAEAGLVCGRDDVARRKVPHRAFGPVRDDIAWRCGHYASRLTADPARCSTAATSFLVAGTSIP
jgi:hypothetical protein